jgi:MFS family permease
VGFLAAVSAAAQMGSRIGLPAALAKFKDRTLIAVSLAVMILSAAVLIGTKALPAFVFAQVAQGFARGTFHTASQTHGVRNPGLPGRRLASVQTASQFGGLLGPAVAGSLALLSLGAALWSAVGWAAAGLAATFVLDPMPPYQRAPRHERVPIWRRKGLGPGSWGTALSGTWTGAAESFIPVILSQAGTPDSRIGWLLSAARGAGFLATASVAKWGGARVGSYVPLAAVGTAVPLVILPFVSGLPAFAVLMVFGGAAGNVAGVLGTAAANAAIEPSEQGAVIALVGVYRAAARMAAPALVSAVLPYIGLPAAMIVVGASSLAPITFLHPPWPPWRRRP